MDYHYYIREIYVIEMIDSAACSIEKLGSEDPESANKGKRVESVLQISRYLHIMLI